MDRETDERTGANGSPLSRGEGVEVARRIGGMAEAGLALPAGLRALADESGRPRERRALHRFADELERGRPLDEAIADPALGIDGPLRGIVQAAARSGRLAAVLAESSRFERIGTELRRQLWLRLAYPTLLISSFLLVVSGIAYLVMPDLEEIYRDFGLELPAVTRWLIDLSGFLRRAGLAVPIGVALAILLVWLAGRGMGRGSGRRVASPLPLIGPLWRNAAMAEFAHLLALLVECRLPLPEALRLAGVGVGDPDLATAAEGAARQVEQGRSAADAIAAHRLFSAGLVRLIRWAETNRALPDAFRMAAELFEARARSQSVLVGAFVMAAVVVLVLLGVHVLILGIYQPLIHMIHTLSM